MSNRLPLTLNFPELDQQVIEEHNKIRTNPSSYIEKLQNSLKYFRSNVFSKPGEDPIQTYEGKAAVEEAIEFLKRQKPVSAFLTDERLNSACLDHINDIGPKGQSTHESSDGKNLSDRIEKYCEWDGACFENLDFGTNFAENIIFNFLVDDGIPERSQRKNMFNADVKYIGVACGSHKEYSHGTVVNYIMSIRDFGEPSPDINNFISDYLKKAEEQKANPNKKKNAFQEEDPDAPDETTSVKIVKTSKIIKGKPTKITRKIYTLSDDSQHIVEIIDA